MDNKIIPIIGLGILAVKGLLNSKQELEDFRREATQPNNEINEETIKPGIALNDFTSQRYGISFKYPKSWSKNPRYPEKYEGPTGFFEVSDFTGIGEDIDEAVKMQINEPYKLYGTNPTIRSFIVDGQPARVIYPSADQPDVFNDRDAALVVQYKTPITIDGETYDYVVIWTTREYIPLIISTLKFVND